ncbi:MAG: YceI family protein [Acidobacteriota bacterium]
MRRFEMPLLLLLGFQPLSLAQRSVEFKAADPLGRNTVYFLTTAPLEDIVGMTNEISGLVRVDPDNLESDEIRAVFEVKMSSLNTGIALRNADLREKYLHTNDFPKAVFRLEKILESSAPRLTSTQPVSMRVAGTFELHGVKREIEVPVKATYIPQTPVTQFKLPGNLLRVSTEFEVRLKDYNIEIPEMLFLRVGKVVHVKLDLFATDADAPQMSAWLKTVATSK